VGRVALDIKGKQVAQLFRHIKALRGKRDQPYFKCSTPKASPAIFENGKGNHVQPIKNQGEKSKQKILIGKRVLESGKWKLKAS
jgi:hypothetical protein